MIWYSYMVDHRKRTDFFLEYRPPQGPNLLSIHLEAVNRLISNSDPCVFIGVTSVHADLFVVLNACTWP